MNALKVKAHFIGGTLHGQARPIDLPKGMAPPFKHGPDASPPSNPGYYHYPDRRRRTVEIYQWIGCAEPKGGGRAALLLLCFESDQTTKEAK